MNIEKTKIKNILYIKNFPQGSNLDYLKKFTNVKLNCIGSTNLIGLEEIELIQLIEQNDIIILGGGKQRLSNPNALLEYPEIINQIILVKLFSSKYKMSNKLLLGICLGSQIIGLAYDYQIKPMNKLIIGFNYLDLNTIDYAHITNSNDKYLSQLDFKLLSKSFSYHYDHVDHVDHINNMDNAEEKNIERLKIIAKSIDNVPYIMADTNIYGFQFHPEVCANSVLNITNTLANNFNCTEFEHFIKSSSYLLLENIHTHFFDVFIKN